MTIADADSVREITIMLRVAAGERVVGAKAVALDQPRIGWLTDEMVRHRAAIEPATLIAPRVEVKLALCLSEPPRSAPATIDELLAPGSQVMWCLEVIDSRFASEPIEPRDLLADNCSAAALLLADEIPAGALTSRRCVDSLLWLARRLAENPGRIDGETMLVSLPLRPSQGLLAERDLDAALAQPWAPEADG
jgi:2-keto-4-pentenoate hydratase